MKGSFLFLEVHGHPQLGTSVLTLGQAFSYFSADKEFSVGEYVTFSSKIVR